MRENEMGFTVFAGLLDSGLPLVSFPLDGL